MLGCGGTLLNISIQKELFTGDLFILGANPEANAVSVRVRKTNDITRELSVCEGECMREGEDLLAPERARESVLRFLWDN